MVQNCGNSIRRSSETRRAEFRDRSDSFLSDRFTFHFLRCPCHASLVSTFLQHSMFSTTFDRIPPFANQASTNYLAARDNSSLGWKFLHVREPHGCIERSIKIRAEERLERHSPGGFQQPTANS